MGVAMEVDAELQCGEGCQAEKATEGSYPSNGTGGELPMAMATMVGIAECQGIGSSDIGFLGTEDKCQAAMTMEVAQLWQ